jgi:hypothetical protein
MGRTMFGLQYKFCVCIAAGGLMAESSCSDSSHEEEGGHAEAGSGQTVGGPDASDTGSESPAEAQTAPPLEGGSCLINTSSYDQSCGVNSDCVGLIEGIDLTLGPGGLPVQSGNYCRQMCLCGGEEINKAAASQFVKDVSMTPLGAGTLPPWSCGCDIVYTPCCQAGRCVAGQLCGASTTDAGMTDDVAAGG